MREGTWHHGVVITAQQGGIIASRDANRRVTQKDYNRILV